MLRGQTPRLLGRRRRGQHTAAPPAALVRGGRRRQRPCGAGRRSLAVGSIAATVSIGAGGAERKAVEIVEQLCRLNVALRSPQLAVCAAAIAAAAVASFVRHAACHRRCCCHGHRGRHNARRAAAAPGDAAPVFTVGGLCGIGGGLSVCRRARRVAHRLLIRLVFIVTVTVVTVLADADAVICCLHKDPVRAVAGALRRAVGLPVIR
eukprot:206524-Chlamydomonas_euryale.AAC.5